VRVSFQSLGERERGREDNTHGPEQGQGSTPTKPAPEKHYYERKKEKKRPEHGCCDKGETHCRVHVVHDSTRLVSLLLLLLLGLLAASVAGFTFFSPSSRNRVIA